MTLPTAESLRELSREEVIAIILQLVERLERLEAELASRKKPPTSSRNSSQPPSRDQKTNPPAPKRRRHLGAKAGHAKVERSLVDQPDKIFDVRPTACGQCGQDLSAVAPHQTVRRQLTELPEIKPVVIETQQHELICPGCGTAQRAALPVGLEAGRHFGPRLEATVIYLQHEQHLSYERSQAALADLFGLEISEGGQGCIMERAGIAATPLAEALRDEIRLGAVVHSDETSARVGGHNWWEWVFRSGAAVLHVTPTGGPSRGRDVSPRSWVPSGSAPG